MKVIILASVAELDVLGKDGRPVSCEHWQIVYVNGEETRSRNCTVNKNYDLQEGSFCQTVDNTAFPHQVVIDLGKEYEVAGFRMLPRAEKDAPGLIRDYSIYLKSTDFDYGQ